MRPKNFEEALNINGHIILTLPNQNFFEYSKTFTSKNNFFKLLNFERKKHYKFFNKEMSFDKILKKKQKIKDY